VHCSRKGIRIYALINLLSPRGNVILLDNNYNKDNTKSVYKPKPCFLCP